MERLQASGGLTPLRRTDNGGYNAALLFHSASARYFVLLARDKDLWRVLQTADGAQALRSYDDFASQSSALAADEIRRLELQAQTEAAQRDLQLAQAQARQMAEELEADRRYRAMIQAQESRNRSDMAALQQQRQQMQEQLLAEQRRVMDLRRQLDPSAVAGGDGPSAAAVRKGAQADCRFAARPGQSMSTADRDLPLCGPDGKPKR